MPGRQGRVASVPGRAGGRTATPEQVAATAAGGRLAQAAALLQRAPDGLVRSMTEEESWERNGTGR
ncbi:hypothetical protein KNE206_60030 [Kitasatospora sp. NE20-6]